MKLKGTGGDNGKKVGLLLTCCVFLSKLLPLLKTSASSSVREITSLSHLLHSVFSVQMQVAGAMGDRVHRTVHLKTGPNLQMVILSQVFTTLDCCVL